MASEIAGSRVLIVDDEEVIAETLALICRHHGFQVVTAYSGEMAIEKAAELHPDVLVSDMILGGISGIEAAMEICRETPGCRVILLSGQIVPAETVADARNRGHHFEFLIKPVHPDVLLRRLQAQA